MATFFNQATLSYSGGVVNSNITTGEIIEVLSATKTAVNDSYTQGDTITYAINLINEGTTPFTGLTIADDLGAYTVGTTVLTPLEYVEDSVTVFADGVLQPTPAVSTDNDTLTIRGITVPAEGVTTVLYTVQINRFAPPDADGTVTNTAVISGNGTTVTVSETIAADPGPMLDITKSLSPETVAENGQLTYTLVIRNTGSTAAVATDDIVITDTFDPILSDIAVTYNGEPLTEPEDYTYNEENGEFATVSGRITVPAATFTQDPVSGEWTVTPGAATITVTGTV